MKPLDDDTYVQVVVTNRGSAPTTITRMVLYEYPSELAIYILQRLNISDRKWVREPAELEQARVFIAHSGTLCRIPNLLQPGIYWIGRDKHAPYLKKVIESGRMYVGIICPHSNKTLFKRLTRRKDLSTREMVRATPLD